MSMTTSPDYSFGPAYDAWRTAYPAHWDEDQPEVEPRLIQMGFALMDDVFIMVTGEADDTEFYNGIVYQMNEDGSFLRELTPTADLWSVINRYLRKGTFDWVEEA
jgi:hypothetical protein